MNKFKVTFNSAGRKAQVAPNPLYPKGIDVDASGGASMTCSVDLPYPAPEVGAWMIECLICGFTGMVTAAGRTDDPRSAKVACKLQGRA